MFVGFGTKLERLASHVCFEMVGIGPALLFGFGVFSLTIEASIVRIFLKRVF
jgi:hypothetical protein